MKSTTRIGPHSYDPNNITGAKLAEIGRWALMGKKMVDEGIPTISDKDVGKLHDVAWLDARVEEICKKGQL